jgi:uncharacterized damage-inducible protein DinB
VRVLSLAFFAAIFMLAVPTAMAQTTMDEFYAKWENSKKYTLDVLDKMPDSSMDYTTDTAAMSFKDQMYHIGSAITGISQGFLLGKVPAFTLDMKTASKAELADYIAKSYDYGSSTMKALTPEQAAEKIEVFGNNVSRRQVMALLMDHSTHHRGTSIAYLRSSGVEPPAFVGF